MNVDQPMPPTLCAYLDAGGILDGFPRLNLLVEALVDRRGRVPAWRVCEDTKDDRAWATKLISGDFEMPDNGARLMATFYLWHAELLAGPDELIDRFVEALPAIDRVASDAGDWPSAHPEHCPDTTRSCSLGSAAATKR